MLNVLLMCFVFRVYESLISIDTTPWHLVWYWAYLSLLLATYSMKMVTSALQGWSPNNVFQGHWDPQVKCATLLAQFVLFFLTTSFLPLSYTQGILCVGQNVPIGLPMLITKEKTHFCGLCFPHCLVAVRGYSLSCYITLNIWVKQHCN